jgi:hypothetical protein
MKQRGVIMKYFLFMVVMLLCTKVNSAPLPLLEVQPKFPYMMELKREIGYCKVTYVVLKDQTVNIEKIRCSNEYFEESVLTALETIRYDSKHEGERITRIYNFAFPSE